MLAIFPASFALMVFVAYAEPDSFVTSTSSSIPSSITGTVVDNPVTAVLPPTRVLHSTTGKGHQFVGVDGFTSEFHGPHLAARSVANMNNWMGYHTTLNDYLATPVPGIHICDRTHFRGNCVYQQVIANPVVCQRLPAGRTQTMGSFLIEKDLQCAFHSDNNCKGSHTWGRYVWPNTPELHAKWDDLTGNIAAYKCRKCDGCDEGGLPDWDGVSTQELQPEGGPGWLVSKDANGKYTYVGVVKNGKGA